MSARYNLSIDAGATYRFSVQVKDSTDEPYDLTDATVAFLTSEFDGPRTHPVSSEAVELSVTPLTGTIQVHLPPAYTRSLRRGRYDLDLTLPSGDVTRLLEGTLAVHP